MQKEEEEEEEEEEEKLTVVRPSEKEKDVSPIYRS